MNAEHAKRILFEVWGRGRTISAAEVKELEPHQHKHETLLDCCQRLAQDTFDWRAAGAFSAAAVEHFKTL